MNKLFFIGIPVILILTMVSCTMKFKAEDAARPGFYTRSVDQRFYGMKRKYRFYIPSGIAETKSYPLVIVLHGAFSNGKDMDKLTGFSNIAEREKFFLAYPEGIGIFGYFQHWNAGFCCGKALKDDIDDVGFVKSVYEDITSILSIDPTRVYLVGYSNGGMLAHRFACEQTHLLAAMSVISASAGGTSPETPGKKWQMPRPETTLPVIFLHGTDDMSVPYEGGRSRLKNRENTYWSVEKSAGFWVENNNCNSQPFSDEINNRVARKTWKECNGKETVVLYTLKGWPHQWPGKCHTAILPDNDPMKSFDGVEIIWRFLSGYRRDTDIKAE